MSLAEVMPYGADDVAGSDRTPPQDVLAEQSVLGAMLLSKDAIGDVAEVVKGRDFYRPAHEIIYEAILNLYGRGEPADAITVADELTKRGELGRVGATSTSTSCCRRYRSPPTRPTTPRSSKRRRSCVGW